MRSYQVTIKTVDHRRHGRFEDHEIVAGTFKAAIRAAALLVKDRDLDGINAFRKEANDGTDA